MAADGPAFQPLLAPGRLGPLELPNRILLPAMDMNLCDHGMITQAEIAHYRARAAGGAALCITGSGAVAYPHGATSSRQPGLSDDSFDPGLTALADAIHAAGGRLCVQLTHHGKAARLDIAEGRDLLVPSVPEGPQDMSSLQDNTPEELSRLAAVTAGEVPTYKEADEDDLVWLIDQFAQAAARVKRAGADAVEIHAAHGYLLSAFLSAEDNRRADRWGGAIENRSRLTTEVVAAVRAAVGDDTAIIVRLNGCEFGGDVGITPTEAVATARLCEAAGADAIHVSGYARNSFADFTDGPLPDTIGAYRGMAAQVKAAVTVPVIAVGRILPETAGEMLVGGECDFVSMGRQLLADPDLAAKLHRGRRSSIRPCINCYVCVEQNFFDDPPRCAVNPALADETAADWPAASPARHVIVVGGGPGGLESARVAAERGHRVTVLEAGDRLGGTAWFSGVTTPANQALVTWFETEIADADIHVRLGERATVETVSALEPDAVVVATGAVRGRPDIPGAALSHVQTGDTLRGLVTGQPDPGQPLLLRLLLRLGGWLRLTTDQGRIRSLSRRYMPVGKRVVIVGGGLVGLELSEFLAERGRAVTVLEVGPALGLPMASPRRWTAVRKAANHGVTLVRGAEPFEITETDVGYRVGDETHRTEADTVIIADEVRPEAPLAEELTAAGIETHVVGDAGDVGYIEGAIHSAWKVAAAL